MNKYYKMIDNGYLIVIGQGNGHTQITEQEYNKILDIIHNKPQAPQGFDYRLKENLEWELYQLPPIPPEPQPQPSEEYLAGYDQAVLDMLGVDYE